MLGRMGQKGEGMEKGKRGGIGKNGVYTGSNNLLRDPISVPPPLLSLEAYLGVRE